MTMSMGAYFLHAAASLAPVSLLAMSMSEIHRIFWWEDDWEEREVAITVLPAWAAY